MLLGTALVIAALALFLYNQNQSQQADQEAAAQLAQLVEQIGTLPTDTETLPIPEKPQELLTAEDVAMTEVVIGGYAYIGYLSIPRLNLELPIMSNWSSKQLQKAPCRYFGTLKEGNLVLMAHNFAKHFGSIGKLQEGDPIFFTDMDGETTAYYVAVQETLLPTDVEAMTSGEYPLTLFTCTYGGRSRVTVRCQFAIPE